jgi:hypothetical protein
MIRAASVAMMRVTTVSSINVKAEVRGWRLELGDLLKC